MTLGLDFALNLLIQCKKADTSDKGEIDLFTACKFFSIVDGETVSSGKGDGSIYGN